MLLHMQTRVSNNLKQKVSSKELRIERISSEYTATTHEKTFHKNKVTNTPSFLPSAEGFTGNNHLIYFKRCLVFH